MNGMALVKKMLPGLIPLLVFILADSIWGTKIGMIVAITFGIAEFLFYRFKDKKYDYFILGDTSLLVILGAISILLDSEQFFLLKPALIEFILSGLLGFSAFSKNNIIMMLSQRYIKDMSLTDGQIHEFKSNVKVLFYLITMHAFLVVYAALYLSKVEWAFISTALFYILLGAFFLFQLLKSRLFRKQIEQEEWLPIVDVNGGVKGKIPRSHCHGNQKILHPVVHLHLIKDDSIFLQKRPLDKLIQPGKWDTAVGGHISFGETIEDALRRESAEELGLNSFKPVFLLKYLWETDMESELVYSFYAKDYNTPNTKSDEIDDGKFWPLQQIRDNLNQGVFTPNFEKEFKLIEQIILK